MVLGGALDVNAADKAARFVWLCDAFGIPLVFLHDVPGFIVGSAVEKQGIIRHGAKMLFAVSEATVPKISVVLRKSYGAGYFVMNGLAYEADYLAIWPTAEIAVMGPDGMVNITMRKQLDAFPEGKERDAARIAMADEFRKNIDPYIAAGHAAGRRRHRPGRDPPRHLAGARSPRDQAGAAALAQARRPAGVMEPRACVAARHEVRACAVRRPRRSLTDSVAVPAHRAEVRAEITANVWQVRVEVGPGRRARATSW